jgi:hypothetical protein
MVAGMAEAGQGCDEPLHGEEEGRPHQDALAEIDLWGTSPHRWYDGFDGQDATMADWAFPGGCGSMFGPLWHVWQRAGGPEGPMSCLLGADHAQKGPTSPLEGPDVSHFSSILTFLAF